jgi:predicted DNA-binding mobile mystery protein A
MTQAYVARRSGVSQAAVAESEKAEQTGDITLATLQRYAAALGCEVSYVLLPRTPLQQVIEEQAERAARYLVERVHHTMILEGQQTNPEAAERLVKETTRRFLAGRRTLLWRFG